MYTLIDENEFGNMSGAGFTDFKVKTYDNLPQFTQSEILKHCLVSVAGFFNTDKYRKQLNINSLSQITKLGAVNWSSKYIEQSATSRTLTSYGNTNYYTYNNSDSKPTNQGRGTLTVETIDTQAITTIYKSIFEASAEVVIDSTTMLDNDIYNDTERINDLNSLIGYAVIDGLFTVARFDKLNGNRILIDAFNNYVTALEKGVIIECKLNLNKSDFLLFDFTQPIYIEQLKSSFFVLDLGSYIENRESSVTLLKM